MGIGRRHWLLDAVARVSRGDEVSEAGPVAAESRRGFSLLQLHPERPQRGPADHSHPNGLPGAVLFPHGYRNHGGHERDC